jgi:hypothetical protein
VKFYRVKFYDVPKVPRATQKVWNGSINDQIESRYTLNL